MIALARPEQATAQPAHPADRFAREIVPFLRSFRAVRSRRLMRKPFGGTRYR
jgi:hypothetical protein